MKKKRWMFAVSIIFIIIAAAMYVYLYMIPNIAGDLTETVIVRRGNMDVVSNTKCIVARDEVVYYAQKSGSVSYYSKETEKTRKGHTILDIYSSANKTSMNCDKTGFVSYYIDGYEDYFVPDSLAVLNIEDYENLDVQPENCVSDELHIGDPAYKLILSNTWYLMLLVPQSDLELYSINSNIKIKLNDTDEINATVTRFLGDGDTRVVVASTKRFYDDFAKLRCLDVEVTVSSVEGYTVPNSAIEMRDDKYGINVLGVDGDYTFKEIEILRSDENNTLIKEGGNIKLYDEVLRDAAKDDAGQY